MSNEIPFALWSPDEDVFWNSWIIAGICTEPHVYTPEYPGIFMSDQTSQGWIPKKNGEIVLGWHANVYISGPLVEQFTYGLPQFDQDGNLLPLFDRTWAAEVFRLTEQPADPVTGFPAGFRNADGVTYCDIRDLKSPTNVRA